jgi:2-polyprenyl-6-hydroxyphenyl methylase/3-demethylubiquinone-9 3-methyltransferase
MSVGALVRRTCGPLEPFVTAAYRSCFFDVEAFVRRLQSVISPARVLEIGCGEGAVSTSMTRAWPSVTIEGIDRTPSVGRLYAGDRTRVRFRQMSAEEFARDEPNSVDLVVLCDVLHHIPWDQHPAILQAAALSLRPGGCLVVKEWMRDGSLPYWVGYVSDRYITGDRIRHGTRDEWLDAFRRAFGNSALRDEFRVGPWACNQAFVLDPAGNGNAVPAFTS